LLAISTIVYNFLAKLAFLILRFKKVKYLVAIFICCASQFSKAQFHTNLSKSELGFMVGGSYYIGDLNRFSHFKNTQPALGILYRYNIHSRLSFRANFSYGSLVGNDGQAKDQVLKNRNLSFRSDIFELAAGVEFNYFPFQLGHNRYKGTAYLLAQIGMFKMNPRTMVDGEWVNLQPLGTEGQGTSLNDKGKYPLYQLCVPLGFGFKLALGKRVSMNVEYGIRKTFTDYIDDVRNDSFVDATQLAAENGPLAARLSNKNLDGNIYGKRGTSATKDWYAFAGVSFTFRLGQPAICFNQADIRIF